MGGGLKHVLPKKFGADFDQYFNVSIDFELNTLNTLIEYIGHNQLPNLIFFYEILHITVKTNMN